MSSGKVGEMVAGSIFAIILRLQLLRWAWDLVVMGVFRHGDAETEKVRTRDIHDGHSTCRPRTWK